MIITGLALIGFFLPLAISMMKSLYLINEQPYTYRLANGLPKETVAIMTILFTSLTLTGIVLIILGWVRRKNKAALDSIADSENQNYCDHCKINVSDQYSNCPVCGKSLQNKGE